MSSDTDHVYFEVVVALLKANKLGVPAGKSVSMPGDESARRAFFNCAGVRVPFFGIGATRSSEVEAVAGTGRTAWAIGGRSEYALA